MNQGFCNIYMLFCNAYQVTEAVQAVEGTCYSVLTQALLHSMCDLKIAQMNLKYSLIQELLPYEFKLGHNAAETTKNIYCVKGNQTVEEILLRLQEP